MIDLCKLYPWYSLGLKNILVSDVIHTFLMNFIFIGSLICLFLISFKMKTSDLQTYTPITDCYSETKPIT